MGKPIAPLVEALQGTAARLEAGAAYQWGHYGSCNCGHLAQTVTTLSPDQIHRLAVQSEGEWREQAQDYCASSGAPLNEVITRMLEIGLSIDDIAHLETLSSPRVLARLPDGHPHLQRNRRDDVVLYMRTWADLLAEEAADEVRDERAA